MAEILRLGTSSRKLDAAAIQQGVTRECPYRPGLTVTVLPAAMFNPRFRQAVQNRITARAAKAMNGQAGKGAKDVEPEYENRYEDPHFIATALVSDMAGLHNEKGNPVKYTPERGESIFSDPGNWDVKEWVVHQATTYGQFYTEGVEEDAKN